MGIFEDPHGIVRKFRNSFSVFKFSWTDKEKGQGKELPSPGLNGCCLFYLFVYGFKLPSFIQLFKHSIAPSIIDWTLFISHLALHATI